MIQCLYKLGGSKAFCHNYGRLLSPLTLVLGLGLVPGGVAAQAISGRVFEDVNYGGGAGRSYRAANTAAVNSGFVAGAIARPGATYTFGGLVPGAYTVRVVSATVTSTRTGNTAAGLLPVQTFRTTGGADDTDRVGGENPAQADAPANAPTVTTSTGANNISLAIVGLTGESGADNTLFLDNVEVLQGGTALTVNPIANPGFEDGTLSGTYQYNP
nr:hypothetical protein [Tanacetum cinerariifolium]